MPKDRPQCGLILEDAEGRILLQLRDDIPNIPYPNRWGTFGGGIEVGESPEEAIIREIREELEYVLEGAEYIGKYVFDGYDIHMFRKVDPNIRLEDLNVREGQKGEFLTRERLKEIEYAFNCREIVEDYVRRFHEVEIFISQEF